MLTLAEIAEAVGLSGRRIGQLRCEGLPARLVGGGSARPRHLYSHREVVAWLAVYRTSRRARMAAKKVATAKRHESPPRRCRDCGVVIGRSVRSCPPCKATRRAVSREMARASTPYTQRQSTPLWVLGAVADYHSGVTPADIAVRVGVSTSSVSVYLRNAGADTLTHQAALRRVWGQSAVGVSARAAWESGAPVAEVRQIMGVRSDGVVRQRAAAMSWDGGARKRCIAAALSACRGGLTIKEYRKAQSRARRYRRRQLHKDLPPPIATGYCTYCMAPLPPGEGTIDHVTPIAHGGAHHIDNLVPACHSCNSSKQDSDLLSWLAWKSRAA